MKSRSVVNAIALGGAVAAYILLARPRQLRWGATNQECDASLVGDELISNADLTATRAITIRVSADQVWPWIAQLGQGRGGFYSYDFLENLVGCDIHSADRIVPDGRTSRSGTRSSSPRRWGSALPPCSRGDRSCSAAGFLWGTPRLPTTSHGPGCSAMNRTGHRGCSCVRDTPTPGRGRGFSSSLLRRSAS